MSPYEQSQRLAVRVILKRILGIHGDSRLSNVELAQLVEAHVHALASQSEAYELAAILREQGQLMGRMDQ